MLEKRRLRKAARRPPNEQDEEVFRVVFLFLTFNRSMSPAKQLRSISMILMTISAETISTRPRTRPSTSTNQSKQAAASCPRNSFTLTRVITRYFLKLFLLLKNIQGVTTIELFPVSGHLVLSASMDGKVKIWETYGKRRMLRTYSGHNKVSSFEPAQK